MASIINQGRAYGGGGQKSKGRGIPPNISTWGAAASVPQSTQVIIPDISPNSVGAKAPTDEKNERGHFPLKLSPCGESWVRGKQVIQAAQPVSPESAAVIATTFSRSGRPKAIV